MFLAVVAVFVASLFQGVGATARAEEIELVTTSKNRNGTTGPVAASASAPSVAVGCTESVALASAPSSKRGADRLDIAARDRGELAGGVDAAAIAFAATPNQCGHISRAGVRITSEHHPGIGPAYRAGPEAIELVVAIVLAAIISALAVEPCVRQLGASQQRADPASPAPGVTRIVHTPAAVAAVVLMGMAGVDASRIRDCDKEVTCDTPLTPELYAAGPSSYRSRRNSSPPPRRGKAAQVARLL